jgi:photosystem II stability/assembly factor-like uncharacterized protein
VRREGAAAARRPLLRSGPRKSRLKGAPAPRLSNHKKRAVWFQSRASWPLREAPVGRLVRERRRAAEALPAAPGTARWELAGPINIGGRLTSVVCDPANPDRVWVGAAGGGVWRSTDGGLTWRALWHRQPILNVGSLALDPADADTVYCGTGEANLSADSYPGVGLYRSTNGGRTWRLVASSRATGIPRRIGTLAIDPFDNRHLLLGGVGYSEAEKGGLHASFDRGDTWTRLSFVSTANYWCHAVTFHPTQAGIAFATITERGTRNGIWKTVDGGQSWTQLSAGLPSPETMGRTSLAISPSRPDVVYAQASDNGDAVLGVFRSDDGGHTWVEVGGGHFADETQMFYGNTIVVDPTDPDLVLCGGVDLHRSTNGGGTWRQATRWDADRGDADYAHADHHALAMPAARPGLVYDANDGGLDVSLDGGRTWTNRSNGLAVTMYYDVDVAQTDGRLYGGGAQDNGTLVTDTGRVDDHFEILGGDGGWIVFDPTSAGHLYASYQHMGLYRWRPGGGAPKSVSPPADKAEKLSVWMSFLIFDPNQTRTLFMGSRRVWRTRNDANDWRAVSPILDDSPITCIEVAPADSRTVYVGTENGGIFRSLDGGDTWSGDLSGATLPGHTITRLETSPLDARTLFATVANFGHSHVFRSADGGTTWTDVDGGRLPDVPHHALLIRPDRPGETYVCSDAGVFVSPDQGATWTVLTRNLPHSPVVDLVYHQSTRALLGATYGRSLWRLTLE